MRTLTLRIHRPWTDTFGDLEGRRALHTARAAMLKEMVADLQLEVVDWGETNSEYPREVVEILVAVASTLIAEAISTYIKKWWAQRKVKDVEVVVASGPQWQISYMNPQEMQSLGTILWDSAKPTNHYG